MHNSRVENYLSIGIYYFFSKFILFIFGTSWSGGKVTGSLRNFIQFPLASIILRDLTQECRINL